jgi:hypothetical protein
MRSGRAKKPPALTISLIFALYVFLKEKGSRKISVGVSHNILTFRMWRSRMALV